MAEYQSIGEVNPFRVNLSDAATDYNGLPKWVDDALAAATGSVPLMLTYYGLPGLGKSYLLKRVKYLIDEGKVEPAPAFSLVVVRVDFRAIPNEVHPYVWMRQAVQAELKTYLSKHNVQNFALQTGGDAPADAREDISRWIERLRQEGIRLVLLLDDLHRVYPIRLKGEGEPLSEDGLEAMRPWLADITLIITMERHPTGYFLSRLFSSGQLIPAGPLTRNRAQEFIEKNSQGKFHPEDVKWIISQTAGHLRLLFNLGMLVWDRYEKTGRLTADKSDDTETKPRLSDMERSLILGQFSPIATEVFDSYWRYVESLTEIEEQALRDLAADSETPEIKNNPSAYGALELLGLLELTGNKLDFFSPMFKEYVAAQPPRKDQPKPAEPAAAPEPVPARKAVGTLSDKEQSVYDVLASRPGEIFSHAQIYEATWKDEAFPADEEGQMKARGKVQVQILRLRKKLKAANRGEQVESVSGEGYRLIRA